MRRQWKAEGWLPVNDDAPARIPVRVGCPGHEAIAARIRRQPRDPGKWYVCTDSHRPERRLDFGPVYWKPLEVDHPFLSALSAASEDGLLRHRDIKNKGYRTVARGREYYDYLRSDAWREVRIRYLKSGLSNRCNACGAPYRKGFHLHHASYENLGNERLTDLFMLCPECHLKLHATAKATGVSLKTVTKRAVDGCIRHGQKPKKSKKQRKLEKAERARRNRDWRAQNRIKDDPPKPIAYGPSAGGHPVPIEASDQLPWE